MLSKLQNKNARKFFVLCFISIYITNTFIPIIGYGLTSGPSQPEVNTFTPATSSDMVDLFTGNFQYNIPLFELPGPNGGYPFNLSYQSGVSVDQEASWVGLGWNLNPGAISRHVRGIPDDFMEDEINKNFKIKKDVTLGLNTGAAIEVLGLKGFQKNIGMYYNNYRGVGFNFGYNIIHELVRNKSTYKLGLSASLDTQKGLSLSPSFSYPIFQDKNLLVLNSGLYYNSLKGIKDIQLGVNAFPNKLTISKHDLSIDRSIHSSSLSFSHSGFTPTINNPSTSYDISFDVKIGTSISTIFPNTEIRGFLQKTNYNHNSNIKTLGYLYQHKREESEKYGGFLQDINREKDQAITEKSTNLAIPSLMCDIYTLSGQGLQGSFKPYLNYVPFLSDNFINSTGKTGQFGVEGLIKKTGYNLTANISESSSGEWKGMEQKVKSTFDKEEDNNAIFKMYGEQRVLPINNFNNKAVDITSGNYKNTTSMNYDVANARSNISIIPIVNKYIKKNSSLLPELITKLDDNSNQSIDRTNLPDHHIGAYIINAKNGNRYIYGLPVQNITKQEFVKSVKGQQIQTIKSSLVDVDEETTFNSTDKFYSHITTPQYTYSHLLTGIIGSDYVDVTGNGISEDDLGYWVKFSYKKTPKIYKWRAPYIRANYIPGSLSNLEDDRAAFNFGEKEIYFLSKVETATHIAIFNTSERKDGIGAYEIWQNSITDAQLKKASKQQKLDNIQIFSRPEYKKSTDIRIPLKTVHFEYDASKPLCPGTPNSLYNNKGKLTLKSLSFTYGNTKRSYLNPYIFNYNRGTEKDVYNTEYQDRWGSYRQLSNNFVSLFYPYTEQTLDKGKRKKYAGLWNISKITIPSGADIHVNYESDTYAYVQDLEAMEMVKLELVGNNTELSSDSFFEFEVPNGFDFNDLDKVFNFNKNNKAQVSFVARMKLNSFKWNDIEGYALLTRSNQNIKFYTDSNKKRKCQIKLDKLGGYNPISMATWQYIQKSEPRLLGSTQGLMDDPSSIESAIINIATSHISLFEQVVRAITGIYTYCEINGYGVEFDENHSFVRIKSFKNSSNVIPVDGVVTDESRADKVILSKYGGGNRVSQITMFDKWNQSEGKSILYGQVYNYEQYNKANQRFESTGVASYEPLIGGKEIPQRKAVFIENQIPLRNSEFSMFELPINENYFPSPLIGYSKVEVYDFVSAKASGLESLIEEVDGIKTLNNNSYHNEIPLNGITKFSHSKKGKKVIEFYTSKDFPVTTGQTNINIKDNKGITNNYIIKTTYNRTFEGTQGYVIDINNMHGQLKSNAFFPQQHDGSISSIADTWTKYYYKTQVVNGKKVLDNRIKTIYPDPNKRFAVENIDEEHLLGVEVENFVDSRRSTSTSSSYGFNFNIDIIFSFFPIPIPTAIPDLYEQSTEINMMVTNKIIHRTGVLHKVESYDNGSLNVSQNLLYDHNTGDVLLTENSTKFWNGVDNVSTNLNSLFSLKIPAYYQYERMGQASINENLEFFGALNKLQKREAIQNPNISGVGEDPNPNVYLLSIADAHSQKVMKKLIKGDEFLVLGESKSPLKVIYIGNYLVGPSIYPAFEVLKFEESSYSGAFKLVRSGNRNLQSLTIQDYIFNERPILTKELQSLNQNTKTFLSPSFSIDQ